MTDPRTLLLIRHGRAHCNDAGVIAGPACTGLTDTGRSQATATAGRLASDAAVTAIHASTTPRAWETAAFIADRLGLPVTAEHGLRVPDPGGAEGQPWQSARTTRHQDPHNPTRPAADGGEAWNAYLDRATATIARLLDEHRSGTLVIVGHSETLAAMLHLLLNVATLGRLKLAFDHCAITTWQATEEWPGVHSHLRRWTLLQHNDTRHLPGTDTQ